MHLKLRRLSALLANEKFPSGLGVGNASIVAILFELPSFTPENQKRYPLNSVCWSDKVESGLLLVGVLVVALLKGGSGSEGQMNRMLGVKLA